jgi:hypothetical protein
MYGKPLWPFTLILAGLCLPAGIVGVPQDHEAKGKEQTRIAFSINPVVDLHFYIRCLLQTEGEVPKEYIEAVEQARRFEQSVSGPLGWGFIEPLLTRCKTAQELEGYATRLPERFRLRSGPVIKPREVSIPYAKALAKVESVFLKKVWPDHLQKIEEANKTLNRLLENHGEAAIEYMKRQLHMKTDYGPVPVQLFAEAPPPGASTSASRGIGAVCFVGVSVFSDSTLAEVVLHEAIHALDLRTRGQPTALNHLRDKLREAGLDKDNPLLRDIPHAVIFVQAGETVRRLINPDHEHYGHDHAFYKKTPEASNRVLPAWKAYLDGSETLDEALGAMVKGLGEKIDVGGTGN